jgi:hypothetical protein
MGGVVMRVPATSVADYFSAQWASKPLCGPARACPARPYRHALACPEDAGESAREHAQARSAGGLREHACRQLRRMHKHALCACAAGITNCTCIACGRMLRSFLQQGGTGTPVARIATPARCLPTGGCKSKGAGSRGACSCMRLRRGIGAGSDLQRTCMRLHAGSGKCPSKAISLVAARAVRAG